jgi:small subunit ribosomal protein S36
MALVAFLVGGWWWALNLLRFGTVQPSAFPEVARPGVDPALGEWAGRYFTLLPVRFWGQFGLLEFEIPDLAVVVATAVVLAAMIAAFARRGHRWALAVTCGPFMLIVVVLAAQTWSSYQKTGVPISGIQGRYLFAAISGPALALAVVVERWPARLRQLAPAIVVALAAVMQGVAVETIVRGFWGGDGSTWLNRLNDMRAWSAFPNELTNAALLGGVVLFALAVVLLSVAGWRRPRSHAATAQ